MQKLTASKTGTSFLSDFESCLSGRLVFGEFTLRSINPSVILSKSGFPLGEDFIVSKIQAG